ncbi:MAG: DoxX family protein [Myxococcota bacterium]|nr:DoxX family protein [Myxococcota bacterium]
MTRTKKILLYVMAAFYIFGGYNHLANPEFYLRMMPPSLPEPEWLNVISGLAEIVLGVFLLEPKVRYLAAWGTIALLIAVFPANVYMATANLGADGPGTGAGAANWFRLPFQALLIAWAYWYTRPEPSEHLES